MGMKFLHACLNLMTNAYHYRHLSARKVLTFVVATKFDQFYSSLQLTYHHLSNHSLRYVK